MSTPFYDLASLVVVPSGYKASKVYAQKPLTTDGQLTFSRASTATRVNASGLIETVSSNVPRLDYTDSTCPKLLLEPSRTNALIYSSAFDDSAWSKGTSGSISANSVVAPDGTTTADAYTFASSTSSFAYLSQAVSGTSQVANTFSIYIKRPAGSGSRTLRLAVTDATVSTGNSSNFTVTESWQRFHFTRTSAATTGSVGVGLNLGTSGTTIAAGEVLHVWGAMLEQGAYPTSLIPTTTAAVTRLADACSKTGISSLIGQTEGTIFIEIEKSQSGYNYYSISDGTNTNWIFIGQDADNPDRLRAYVKAGTVTTDIFVGPVANGTYKMAMGYKNNDVVFYVNGTLRGTDTSTTIPSGLSAFALTNLPSSSSSLTNKVSQAILFKTRLTNAQLAELTAL